MILFSLLLALTAAVVPVPVSAREIQVNLQAPWTHRAVHPLVEVAEFLAEQSSSDFWTYVDNIGASPSEVDTIDEAMLSPSVESLQNISQLALTWHVSSCGSVL